MCYTKMQANTFYYGTTDVPSLFV